MNASAGRSDDHIAIDRVEDHQIALRSRIQDLFSAADDCRDLQRVRHDGGMARLAADGRREALDIFVELRRIRRRQIVCHDDGIFIDRRQVRNGQTEQIALQAERHILDVCRSFSEVIIIHGFEHRHHLGSDRISRILRIDLVRFDHVHDLAGKLRVSCHHQVRIEYRQFLFGQTFCRALFHPFDILLRLFKRRVKFLHFRSRIAFLLYNLHLWCFQLVNSGDGNTSRCRNTF